MSSVVSPSSSLIQRVLCSIVAVFRIVLHWTEISDVVPKNPVVTFSYELRSGSFSNLVVILLTHILACKTDQSAGHIERVLAPLQHAAQPIQRRILV